MRFVAGKLRENEAPALDFDSLIRPWRFIETNSVILHMIKNPGP